MQAGVCTVLIQSEKCATAYFIRCIERYYPYEFYRVSNPRISRFPSFFSERSNVYSHSISSLSCAHRVIAVANLYSDPQRINKSSSQSPTRDYRMEPYIAAPRTNILAANCFYDRRRPCVSMTRTSIASPYVAVVND